MKQAWKDLYSALPEKIQVRLLALLAHDVTFWSRSYYEAATEDASVSAELLASTNEWLHRITEQLNGLVTHHEKVYPDSVFLDICDEYAEQTQCRRQLDEFFENVTDAQARQNALLTVNESK